MQPYFVKFYLGGEEIEDVTEREEISIQVDFKDTIQGNIETDAFTFVNRAYEIIEQYRKDGLAGGVGLFEGLDFKILIQQGPNQQNIFEGFLNFETYQNLKPSEPKILCEIKKTDGINNLSERLEGLTFSYLRTIGVITPSDYDYVNSVVEKKFNVIETLFLVVCSLFFYSANYSKFKSIAQNWLLYCRILVGAGITGQ